LGEIRVNVLDYGFGNLTSVCGALSYLGAQPQITKHARDFDASIPLIIPGVGAFPAAMEAIDRRGFRPIIAKTVESGTPVLGICLGLQVFFEIGYEFAPTQGLGLVPGEVRRIFNSSDKEHPVRETNIGWRKLVLSVSGEESDFLRGVQHSDSFYFVHSFAAFPADSAVILATHFYGGFEIVSVVKKENLWGVQFHPEKSGDSGLKVLSNFLRQ
jgi:imidazole glycerol-phosphate synthase subunit HisH